jgi:hypothetical protein
MGTIRGRTGDRTGPRLGRVVRQLVSCTQIASDVYILPPRQAAAVLVQRCKLPRGTDHYAKIMVFMNASQRQIPTTPASEVKKVGLSYRPLVLLAVAATSPRHAATYTCGAPHPVDPPPAHAASRTSTTAATSAAETDATATTATPAASATTSAATMTTSAAATSGELDKGVEWTGVFFVEDVESSQAHVSDFLLTQKDVVAHARTWDRVHDSLSGRATRKRQQTSGAQHGHGVAPAFSDRHLLCS